MFELVRTQAFTLPARLLPTANQSLAKHNRKPSQLIENNHQHPKSIASFCHLFLDYAASSPTDLIIDDVSPLVNVAALLRTYGKTSRVLAESNTMLTDLRRAPSNTITFENPSLLRTSSARETAGFSAAASAPAGLSRSFVQE